MITFKVTLLVMKQEYVAGPILMESYAESYTH